MEPLLIILVPGIIGGGFVALVLALRPAPLLPKTSPPPPRRALTPPSPSLINMARIQPDGLGGLGMVAMALAVAISVPWIRLSVSLGLLLGAIVAAVLIASRRRAGPLTSSSRHAGAHSDGWAWDDPR